MVRNIVDVALPFTAAEQDVLNPVGVNLIRDLTPRGIRVWGARTISSDQEWKYVNFRTAVHLPRAFDRPRHPMGRVRAEFRSAVGEGRRDDHVRS